MELSTTGCSATSDEPASNVVPYSAFLERRERRRRIAEDFARRPSEAVIVEEPPVRAPHAYRTERARRWWLEH
jgi:hypothetical protein